MSFPHFDRTIFRNNPLDQVICQLRFPTILQLETDLPANFQNEIRELFPLYARRVDPVFDLPEDAAQLAQMAPTFLGNPSMQTIHDFSTIDKKWIISLSSNFIALTSKDYQRWETFEGHLNRAIEVLVRLYKPAFFQRTGLRYVNVLNRKKISGNPQTPWSQLLQPYVAGMLVQNETEKLVAEQNITEIIDLLQHEGRVKSQRQLARHVPTNEIVYIIDNDFFTDSQVEVKNVFAVLNTFRERAGSLFIWSITPELYKRLEPGNPEESK